MWIMIDVFNNDQFRIGYLVLYVFIDVLWSNDVFIVLKD